MNNEFVKLYDFYFSKFGKIKTFDRIFKKKGNVYLIYNDLNGKLLFSTKNKKIFYKQIEKYLKEEYKKIRKRKQGE